jgi:hypothetical protein
MTNQQRINALFTAMACVIDMKLNSNDLVEFELVSSLKELSNDPMFDSLKQEGFDKNFFGVSKSGNLFPTKKGVDLLFGEPVTKIVSKMQTKPVEKMTDNEVIENFIATGNEICQRIPNGVVMQKKVYTNYNKIYDAASCVVENINNFVANLTFVEETV